MSPSSSSAARARTRSQELLQRYRDVRAFTRTLASPLEPEDCVVQSMPDVSPTRWHLAHVTWFFETFVLGVRKGHRPFDPAFHHLFNSYYQTVGEPFPRARRGLLSRPTVAEVIRYREHVDGVVGELLEAGALDDAALDVVELGLHHEQQHQELLLTDIKHVFSCNPLLPAYRTPQPRDGGDVPPLRWIEHGEGLHEIGYDGEGFAFDNERPRHRVFVESFELGSRLVTNGEFLAFVRDGGYQQPNLWLDEGFAAVRREGWRAPLYWHERDGTWHEFTLGGLAPLDTAAPVCHLSGYEADAYARWAGARLPTEAEWEMAAERLPVAGHFVDDGALHPLPADRHAVGDLQQMFGDVWEWTMSAYAPYPGFRPLAGSLGEYNGKFMCSQLVLRGGSCLTSRDHVRPTYRTFFYPHQRWQMTGLRLARPS